MNHFTICGWHTEKSKSSKSIDFRWTPTWTFGISHKSKIMALIMETERIFALFACLPLWCWDFARTSLCMLNATNHVDFIQFTEQWAQLCCTHTDSPRKIVSAHFAYSVCGLVSVINCGPWEIYSYVWKHTKTLEIIETLWALMSALVLGQKQSASRWQRNEHDVFQREREGEKERHLGRTKAEMMETRVNFILFIYTIFRFCVTCNGASLFRPELRMYCR